MKREIIEFLTELQELQALDPTACEDLAEAYLDQVVADFYHGRSEQWWDELDRIRQRVQERTGLVIIPGSPQNRQ